MKLKCDNEILKMCRDDVQRTIKAAKHEDANAGTHEIATQKHMQNSARKQIQINKAIRQI